MKNRMSGYSESNKRFGVLITLPALFVLITLFIYPLVYSICVSFTDYTVANVLSGNGVSFVGLDNYVSLLKNGKFLNTIKATCLIAIPAVALEFSIGLLISASVSRIRRFKGFFTTLFMMTIMIAPVVVSLLFKFLLGDELGVLNGILKAVGLIRADIPWLTDENLARLSITMIDTWQATSTIFLLLYTAIIAIPTDVIEAARIDGAGVFQCFFRVVLPMIKPVIVYSMVIRFMDAFRIFDAPYMVTNGGPAGATESMSLFIYRKSWTDMDISSASASSFIMMILLIIGMTLIRQIGKRRDKEV